MFNNGYVRKYLFILFIVFLLLPAASHQALAQYKEVLGISTNTQPQIPATPDGPGFILPDSPLFFLDKLKQQVRLTFALTPQAKASVYNSVAGERLAELRIMLDRSNRQGIAIDLREVSDNIAKAADELKSAKLLGKDTKLISRNLNTSIREKMDSLDLLRSQSEGVLQEETKATLASLLTSKTTVEDILPEGDLANEIQGDLQRKLNIQVADTATNVHDMVAEIQLLNQQASRAAQETRTRREQLIAQMIAEKNNQLNKNQQQLLLSELQKQDQMFQLQGQASEQAQKAAKDAQIAIQKYQEASEALQYLKNHPVTASVVGQQSLPSGTGQSVAGTETSKK